MPGNCSPTYSYREAQIGMQIARKIFEKKRSLHWVNEHFSQKFCVQDAPNMGFSGKME